MDINLLGNSIGPGQIHYATILSFINLLDIEATYVFKAAFADE